MGVQPCLTFAIFLELGLLGYFYITCEIDMIMMNVDVAVACSLPLHPETGDLSTRV